MKKCTYCGKEHPDDAVACSVDGQPLETVLSPQPPAFRQNETVKELTYIGPLRAGIILAILQGALGLILMPFFFLTFILGSHGSPAAAFGAVFFIFVPVGYAIMGFLTGVIGAVVYNLIAKWVGGFEFRVQDKR